MIKLDSPNYQKFMQRLGAIAIAIFLPLAIALSDVPAAYAFDSPELLPEVYSNVIDLGRFLNESEETVLDQKLSQFEQQTGWKLRVLTQVDRTPGRAVKDFWGLNDRSVMLVADARGRNLLNFSVGDAVYPLLSRTFWIELQSRYGNQFYVREQGYDQSILSAIDAITICLAKDGCAVVPGIPQEQWILTLITSIVGGVVFGFAGHPRKDGEIFAWKWALIFTPLWGMLFISFGLGPVLTRTSEWMPIVRNVAGFVGGAVIAYLIPSPKRAVPSPEIP
ncbi:TPM domain-containing protein [Pseudanabaena sp. FACHB-1277]|uniref:TPM domain-containing protein n=1 Tax=Pseudanabaena cinerea FACHB-1277 TaxID=2949581 RepID=A0A926UQ07_9CYAN|nr:TPM domain-containing protein [Pseudanabaena cinerea]MBD2149139.1 TPM domain-containing protein [Pseudanabaena cinerea FACHB-1277]